MSDPRELYKATILAHERAPRNEGTLEQRTHHARGSNPLCGDRVDVDVRVVDDRIQSVRFVARGCAIAKASASIMTTIVDGRTVEEAKASAARLEALLERGNDERDEALGALLGVRSFPGRTRCATLAWTTLVEAFDADT